MCSAHSPSVLQHQIERSEAHGTLTRNREYLLCPSTSHMRFTRPKAVAVRLLPRSLKRVSALDPERCACVGDDAGQYIPIALHACTNSPTHMVLYIVFGIHIGYRMRARSKPHTHNSHLCSFRPEHNVLTHVFTPPTPVFSIYAQGSLGACTRMLASYCVDAV